MKLVWISFSWFSLHLLQDLLVSLIKSNFVWISFWTNQFVIAALLAVAVAAPAEDAPVGIVSSNSEVNADGSYTFGWVDLHVQTITLLA